MDGTAAEREPLGKLSGGEVYRIYWWGEVFDGDGTLLVVFLDGTEIECKNEEE